MAHALVLHPARNLNGALRPPGDKSISHRYALFAGLAAGRSQLSHFSTGADCRSTLGCLAALGAEVSWKDGETVEIEGHGLHGLRAPTSELDAGNSGTTIRLLAGILAAQPFTTKIGGDASLSRRPMRRVIDPLSAMGARIGSADGRPPLEFEPAAGGLRPLQYTLPVASAQVKSALLLAALYAAGESTIEEPLPTRDHTELALAELGVEIARRRGAIALTGPAGDWPGRDYRIPGDPSSAAFFLCAAAMFPEANLLVEEVSLNPTRTALLDLLRRLGAKLSVVSVEERGGELCGSLQAGGSEGGLRGGEVAGAETVALIDEIPILAVLATSCAGGLRFRDAGELRVKESDRIAALAHNLRAMGAECEESADGLYVPGPQRLHGARLQSFGDHRIAMAFAIAALRAEGDSELEDPDCAGISYPEYFTLLEKLAER